MSFTFDFTEDKFAQLISHNTAEWYQALVNNLPQYDIHTPERVSAFIAQCAHESGGFKRLKENLNYKWESLRRVFPKYFPTDDVAQEYAHKPEQIANRIYGGRMSNGDEASGDGFRFCGRGLIQLTGRHNYTKFADHMNMAVEDVPQLLETYDGAVKSACWFWHSNSLNQWADASDILTLTKRINGGTIGLEDRIKHYNHAREVLQN